MQIEIVSNEFNFSSLDSYVNNINSRIKNGGLVGIPIKILEKTTISGLPAIKTEGTTPGILTNINTYYVARGNMLYALSLNISKPEEINKSIGETLYQILSTFKF